MRTDLAIIIFGRNELVREGLGRILSEQGFRVVATPSQIEEVIEKGAETDIVLIDSSVSKAGLADCQRIHEGLPDARIVLMVDEFSAEDVAEAFQADVLNGYVIKAIACKPLAGALRLVAMGEKVFPSQVVESLAAAAATISVRPTDIAGGGKLSPRELEILACLVSGDPNKVISRRLNISDATVKVHIKAILRKLRVVNRTQAAIWAAGRGLTTAACATSLSRESDTPAMPMQMLAPPMAALPY